MFPGEICAKLHLRHGIALIVCAFGFVFAGCSQEHLQELEKFAMALPDPAYVETDFCTEPASVIQTRLKYIFILDRSASNSANYQIRPDGSIVFPIDPNPLYATDPTGARRFPPLIQSIQNSILNQPIDDTWHYYALINFATEVSVVQGFTNNRAGFLTTVQNQYNNGAPADQGATNYLDALDAAYNMINNDINSARGLNPPISSTYVVVFVSDGFPILRIALTNPPTVTAQASTDIIQSVKNIMALGKVNTDVVDNITLFTGYYYVDGNSDPNARQLLADMATVGNGVSYTFGTGAPVDFSLFQVPPKTIKWNISDLFVTNRSTAWWGGQLELDSDGDGLPDSIEVKVGSDPHNADSDGNGVSDFVEYMTHNGAPCNSIGPFAKDANGNGDGANHCAIGGALNYFGTGGSCSALPNRTRYLDSDLDGLNDCEEAVLGNVAGIHNFDSNSDGIPDFLEFKNGMDFIANTNPAGGDSDEDSVTNYDEVKANTPVLYPNDRVIGLSSLRYELDVLSSTALQECYRLRVYNMATIGPNNNIRVYLLENTPQSFSKKLMRVADKAFAGSSKILTIGDAEPGVWRRVSQ